jgi:squalene-hopene/tetraprenyl-beta-curcumene cyclase
MTSGPGANRIQSYFTAVETPSEPRFRSLADAEARAADAFTETPLPAYSPVGEAVARTRQWLLAEQHADGHWCGELEGDTILESEYVLLLAWLGRERERIAVEAAEYIRRSQLPTGGWAIYPGGPLEVSASVKAYLALRLTGHDLNVEYMQRARQAIVAAGGAEGVNSFTRYYLALLGVIGYAQCPAVPPELILIPRRLPFNVYEMSAWSRTIIVPLSLLWHFKPRRELPEHLKIRELFVDDPRKLSPCMPPAEVVGELSKRTWLDWDALFRTVDRTYKFAERWGLQPLRGRAVRRAEQWMTERFEHSDGLGAIFPPIVWSVVALKCLGHDDDSPLVRSQLHELERLMLREPPPSEYDELAFGSDDASIETATESSPAPETAAEFEAASEFDDEPCEPGAVRLQPCKSPVWDTAIATLALREAGVAWNDPAIRRSVEWLLAKEVRVPGDWAVRNEGHEAGGWFFEYENRFYPDVDDTGMVLMALAQCLPDDPDQPWTAEFFLQDGWSPHPADRGTAAVVSSRIPAAGSDLRSTVAAVAAIDRLAPQLAAIRRGVRWILAMQNKDGGWGAFDKDNDRVLFTRVPFADHNAMIDPSTADLTARMLEMFGRIGIDPRHPVVKPSVDRALAAVWREQESDGAWYGRWGVNYLYGTWQAVVGLVRIGVSPDHPRIRDAVRWLKSVQQASGGWGETPASYDDPTLRGQGPETASQTAWALMALMAAGETQSASVRRGVAYLLDTQNPDGTWDEPWWTGTGFPRVFYLKYHLYRIYWPLMALGRYERLTS